MQIATAFAVRRAARAAPRTSLGLLPLGPHAFGEAGEAIACRVLEQAGWRVLARRLWAGDAEFDLLLARGAELLICEVKASRLPRVGATRTPSARADPAADMTALRWRPADRVDEDRVARLWSAARRLERDTRRTVHVEVIEVLCSGGFGAPGPIV